MLKKKNKLDSKEELHATWFFKELKNAGYIDGWVFAKTFELSDPLKHIHKKIMKKVPDKVVEQHITHGHKYTPDFEVRWTKKAYGIFIQNMDRGEKITTPFISQTVDELYEHTIMEVKGNFDYQNMTRLAVINKKWMWDKLGVFVNMMMVPSIFEKLFMPKRYIFTDKSMDRRVIKFKVRTLEEYLKKFDKKENLLL